jgi:hypothetical protein
VLDRGGGRSSGAAYVVAAARVVACGTVNRDQGDGVTWQHPQEETSMSKRSTSRSLATPAAGVLIGLLLSAPHQAPAQPPDADTVGARLPVRRVVLYKSGVGFFEHIGRITGNQTLTIALTSTQLDDVLKSLTTVDMGNGEVTGITFGSTAPVSERLRTLGLPIGERATRSQLIGALRGARFDVQRSGVTVTGRVLALAPRERQAGDSRITVDELTIVTDAGVVRSFDLDTGTSVRVADAELRRELAQYLDLIDSTRSQAARRLSVNTRGNGVRDLFVSYVSAVPVWKTTYRLVMPADPIRKPFLQGWAIVDNTLGEDWENVQLSLVAGAPQSFIQQLSQPLYTRRPVVPLPSAALLTPQTHGATMSVSSDEAAQRDALQRAAAERGIPGGALGGVVGGLPSPAPPPPPPAGPVAAYKLAEGRLRDMEAAATGGDLGDLFEYRLKQPITILRNQSALVPILQADVSVERVSLWSGGSPGSRPLRAVWLTNDTGLTLDGGSLTLVEGGAFAGDGLVEPIKPNERRLISYAADLATRVNTSREGGPRRVTRVRIANGTLTEVVEERATTVYTVRNEDKEARQVIVEHPIQAGWRLAGGAEPEETSASAHRFRVRAEPNATTTLTVDEVLPLERSVAVSTLTDDHVALVLRGRDVDASVEPQLRGVLAQSRGVSRLREAIAERQQEISRIAEDQTRVRENLKALGTSGAERQLTERYARQLATQEDRLEALRRDVDALGREHTDAHAELVRRIDALAVDVEIP